MSLALARSESLKVELCRAFALVLGAYPSTRLQLHILVPFLSDRAVRMPLVAAFRHAVASVSPLLVSSQVLRRSHRASDGDDRDEAMEPTWSELDQGSVKRRKVGDEGLQGEARLVEPAVGLAVVDQITLEMLWPVFHGMFQKVLSSTPPQVSSEMRNDLQRLDATVRIVLPFCQNARSAKGNAGKGKRRRDRVGLEKAEEDESEVLTALLTRVGDWMQLTVRLCQDVNGEAADVVQTLVSLVDEALDFVPGALIAPWAQDILHLVELPWKLSSSTSSNSTKNGKTTTTTSTSTTTTTTTTPFPASVMQACLRLLGRLPVLELETEMGLLDAALRHKDSHVRATGVRVLPSFLVRIPHVNGQRSQYLKRYLKTLM
jgi:hypothetical protein